MTDDNTVDTNPEGQNPAEGSADMSDRPGRILGSAHLKIQTRQAQRLVYGRRRTADKNQIIGMLQFGFFVQKIWAGASMDDPYADWYLLKVHDALERGREEIAEMKAEVDNVLKSMSNLQIDIAHSVEPILIPVQFPNPFGYMGAYLIADYDDLTLSLLTARHFGLLDRSSAEKSLARGASVVRRTFMSSAGWKNTGVTRADFFLPTSDGKQRAQKATELMGECPPKVLDGSLRSSMAPQVRQRTVDLDAIRAQNADAEEGDAGTTNAKDDFDDGDDDSTKGMSAEEMMAQAQADAEAMVEEETNITESEAVAEEKK